MFGVEECPSGTNRHNRLINDSRKVAALVKKIDLSIPESSILYCSRLGAFATVCSWPILAKLSRTCEVCAVHSQRFIFFLVYLSNLILAKKSV